MRNMIVAAVAMCLTALPARWASAAGPQGVEAYTAEANAIIKDFMTNLKMELVRALKAGGPANAVAVCQAAAPAITKDMAKAHGWDVGRTALRVRNPANKPNDWEREVLEAFVKKASEGADPKTLTASKIVEQEGQKTFRYMKAIPMAKEPCATCHGENLDPALRAKIRELYPQDQAVGFKPGEIRGAFTLSRKID